MALTFQEEIIFRDESDINTATLKFINRLNNEEVITKVYLNFIRLSCVDVYPNFFQFKYKWDDLIFWIGNVEGQNISMDVDINNMIWELPTIGLMKETDDDFDHTSLCSI